MTIAEIAKLAGTSRGTVDRVLNGRGKVNKELEKKIREIIESSEYEVNSSARALSMSQKKYVVGVVINSIGNPFSAACARALRTAAKSGKITVWKCFTRKYAATTKRSILKR